MACKGEEDEETEGQRWKQDVSCAALSENMDVKADLMHCLGSSRSVLEEQLDSDDRCIHSMSLSLSSHPLLAAYKSLRRSRCSASVTAPADASVAVSAGSHMAFELVRARECPAAAIVVATERSVAGIYMPNET